MKKIEIPIIDNKISAAFPRKCVCCEKSAETFLKLPFSKKVVISSVWIGDEEKELESIAYRSEFKIPYCLKHAKESKLMEFISRVLFLILSLLSASLILYLLYIMNLTGIRLWIGALILSLIMGLLMGLIEMCCISSILFLFKRHFLFGLLGNVALGIRIKLSSDRKSLIFIFTNNNIAHAFAKLNHVELKHFGPPLHRAIIEGSIARVIILLLMGCDVNEKEKGLTPLHLAAEKGHRRIASLLIRKGANVNASKEHITPLHSAMIDHHLDIAILLVKNGADINARDDQGFTLLHVFATQEKYNYMVSILIDLLGADVNARSNWGFTPLHLASAAGEYLVSRNLVSNKANVNSRNLLEQTPLHLAAEKGHMDIVELLIDNNAETNCKSSDGRTPLDIARENGHKAIAEFLIKKDTRV